MELKILHYLLLIVLWVTLTHQLALAEQPTAKTEADSCTSSTGPDGEERRCKVLWLPIVATGGLISVESAAGLALIRCGQVQITPAHS
jgi:hypothetical protein